MFRFVKWNELINKIERGILLSYSHNIVVISFKINYKSNFVKFVLFAASDFLHSYLNYKSK